MSCCGQTDRQMDIDRLTNKVEDRIREINPPLTDGQMSILMDKDVHRDSCATEDQQSEGQDQEDKPFLDRKEDNGRTEYDAQRNNRSYNEFPVPGVIGWVTEDQQGGGQDQGDKPSLNR